MCASRLSPVCRVWSGTAKTFACLVNLRSGPVGDPQRLAYPIVWAQAQQGKGACWCLCALGYLISHSVWWLGADLNEHSWSK